MRDLIPDAWSSAMRAPVSSPSFTHLEDYVRAERNRYPGRIFPAEAEVFAALQRTPLGRVRAVILGQDPYHTLGMAHGLAFSVPPDVKRLPGSLRNIRRELTDDLGSVLPESGSLVAWAANGVLLLNRVLTVRQGEAGSHAGQGWEAFTRGVIETVNASTRPMVFMLWGRSARSVKDVIASQHIVLETSHPSPLSARRGFLGSRPFSEANRLLASRGLETIDWSL
jgi:uracil-DNA glycosylase